MPDLSQRSKYRCEKKDEAGKRCVLTVMHVDLVPCKFEPTAKTAAPKVEAPKQRMNKTETRYANILQGYVLGGEILSYEFGAFTFRLGDRTRYTPDFMVVRPDRSVEFHEVKGSYIWEDARVKLKVTAAKFPFKFVLAQWKKGQWNISEVKP